MEDTLLPLSNPAEDDTKNKLLLPVATNRLRPTSSEEEADTESRRKSEEVHPNHPHRTFRRLAEAMTSPPSSGYGGYEEQSSGGYEPAPAPRSSDGYGGTGNGDYGESIAPAAGGYGDINQGEGVVLFRSVPVPVHPSGEGGCGQSLSPPHPPLPPPGG